MSPGPTRSASNALTGSSTITGSPANSIGVAPATTNNQRGVITLYPTEAFAGFTSITLLITHSPFSYALFDRQAPNVANIKAIVPMNSPDWICEDQDMPQKTRPA